MRGCNYIKRMIDEAEKSDSLPFEASEHIGRCGDCERFANDRARLRGLLAADSRVNAPVNFDAMLKVRMAEANGRSAFSWFGSASYLRLGAVTAGLVLMVFAAQYSGLFLDHSNPPATSKAAVAAPPITAPTFKSPAPSNNIPSPVATTGIASKPRQYYQQNLRGVRTEVAMRGRTPAGTYFTAEDGGVVLVRGRNGDMDVPMPTVSVGAQPLLYVSAGQRATRSAANSF